MKILYVIDSLNNGGAERQLALLVKYLPPECERRVFSLGDGQFANIIRSFGIPVDICERKSRFDPRPAFALWHLLIEWKPDVVHSWGWMSSVAAGFSCNVLGIPFIDGTIRTGGLLLRRALGRLFGMLWARRVIANSQAGLNAWKVSPKKGRVVYNGFDPERLTLCDATCEKPESPFIVIMVGRMHPEKDYETFIDAIRLIAKNEVNCRFIALGQGDLREALLKQAGSLVESGILIFPEPTLEVLPYVKKAHVGVLMTAKGIHEGISNAIMEYMACGLPVICSEGGGNSELVVNNETGYLIPVRDTNALVDRLLHLRNCPQVAERLGKAGRQRLLDNFSVGKMVQAILQIYAELR